MLHPGKFWLLEETSLNQALVKLSYCSSTARPCPGANTALGACAGEAPHMEGRGWRSPGCSVPPLPPFQTGALAGCLADTAPDLNVWLRHWRATISSWPRAGTQGHSSAGAAGACQGGTDHPEKSSVPRAPGQHPQAVISPSAPAPTPPWGQEPTGRAHLAQKEAAKSRGEG